MIAINRVCSPNEIYNKKISKSAGSKIDGKYGKEKVERGKIFSNIWPTVLFIYGHMLQSSFGNVVNRYHWEDTRWHLVEKLHPPSM